MKTSKIIEMGKMNVYELGIEKKKYTKKLCEAKEALRNAMRNMDYKAISKASKKVDNAVMDLNTVNFMIDLIAPRVIE